MGGLWVPPPLYTGKEQQEFEKRFHYASGLKDELRRQYALSTRNNGFSTFDDNWRRAHDFWSEYEDVNRVYIPEDPVYSKATTGVAAATTNSTWSIKAAATQQIRILESFM